jgi:hypothetical protein
MLASHSEGPVIVNTQANPMKVAPGESLAVTVEVADSLGISSAVAEFPYEGGSDKVNMILLASVGNKHTYQAVWLSHDTMNQKWYNTTVTVTNAIGKRASVQVPWQDPTQGHDASSIRAGTFSAGNYAFPNNLTVGGTNLFVDNSTGRVGIGNTGPDTKLHVTGGVCIDTDAVCTDPGAGNLTAANVVSASYFSGAGTGLTGTASGLTAGDVSCTNCLTDTEVASADYATTAGNIAGNVVQIVNNQTGEVATGTTIIPFDDTIPQNTEGDEYMTLAITPTNVNNILLIDVCFQSSVLTGHGVVVALFQDSTANALASAFSYEYNSGGGTYSEYPVCFTHKMSAGTTSSTTFKVRAGVMTAGTLTFNGHAGARRLGGVTESSITIMEIKA